MKLQLTSNISLPIYQDSKWRSVIFLDKETWQDLKTMVQDAIDEELIQKMVKIAIENGMKL